MNIWQHLSGDVLTRKMKVVDMLKKGNEKRVLEVTVLEAN